MCSTDASGGEVTQMLVEANRDRALADLGLEG
jgi:hypothetical protein